MAEWWVGNYKSVGHKEIAENVPSRYTQKRQEGQRISFIQIVTKKFSLSSV
jgi:hypothetical protein